jgi:NAD-specific glutamate dehydrogenase
VDSVASAVTNKDIVIHRLLHPVVHAARDAEGSLPHLEHLPLTGRQRESIIYMEVDRADAGSRRDLFRGSAQGACPTSAAPSATGDDAAAIAQRRALVDDPKVANCCHGSPTGR